MAAKHPRSVSFVVFQDPYSKRWHYKLRAAGNEFCWFVSAKKGYARRERAVANCKHIYTMLRDLPECPLIIIEDASAPESLAAELLNTSRKDVARRQR